MICGVKDKITINQVSAKETISKDSLSNKALKSLILFRRPLVFNSKYLKKLEEQSEDSAGTAVDGSVQFHSQGKIQKMNERECSRHGKISN